MRIIYGHETLAAPLENTAMTVGTFDGVHLGHQRILRRVVQRAKDLGGTSVVYSFFPPPWRVLGRTENPFLITTFQDKARLIAGLGVDILVTETFTSGFRALTAQEFIRGVLLKSFHPRDVLVGYDFRFGKQRKGNLELLQQELSITSATASQQEVVLVDDEPVSSTRIRKAVVGGDMQLARRLLGRRHFISGAVVRGRGRGRTLGFPTANISPRTELIPGPGVYAVLLEAGDERISGVANLGYRPTFAEDNFSVEAFLFDFEGDLYGVQAKLHFVERIRGERKFESKEALVAQIDRDVVRVRALMPFDEFPS